MSITYYVQRKKCRLQTVSSREGKVTLSEVDTRFFDRNCTYDVELIPSSFQLDVVDQKLEIMKEATSTEIPLGKEDFEIDLTNSNNWDGIKRSVSKTEATEVQLSTESGFTTSESTTDTKDESKTDTKGTNKEDTHGSESSESFSTNVGTSLSASAGFDAGFASASVTATFSASLNTESTSTSGQSSTDSVSRTQTNTRSSSASNTRAESSIFNYGFTESQRFESTETYDYSLTVPSLHKGLLAFTVKNEPVTIKIRTILNLNGYVKLRVKGVEFEEHVSRLLPSSERELSTLSTITYQRSIVTGKVVMTDKNDQPAAPLPERA